MEHVWDIWHIWIWPVTILAAAVLTGLAAHTALFFILKRLTRQKGNVFVNSLMGHGRMSSRWILPFLTLMALLPAARLSEDVLTPIERAIGLGLIAATAWLLLLNIEIISHLLLPPYPKQPA